MVRYHLELLTWNNVLAAREMDSWFVFIHSMQDWENHIVQRYNILYGMVTYINITSNHGIQRQPSHLVNRFVHCCCVFLYIIYQSVGTGYI